MKAPGELSACVNASPVNLNDKVHILLYHMMFFTSMKLAIVKYIIFYRDYFIHFGKYVLTIPLFGEYNYKVMLKRLNTSEGIKL